MHRTLPADQPRGAEQQRRHTRQPGGGEAAAAMTRHPSVRPMRRTVLPNRSRPLLWLDGPGGHAAVLSNDIDGLRRIAGQQGRRQQEHPPLLTAERFRVRGESFPVEPEPPLGRARSHPRPARPGVPSVEAASHELHGGLVLQHPGSPPPQTGQRGPPQLSRSLRPIAHGSARHRGDRQPVLPGA